MVAILDRDKEHLTDLICPSDQRTLSNFYVTNPHPGLHLSSDEFLDGILTRLYEEGHYEEYLSPLVEEDEETSSLNSYDFDSFIERETHLDLVDRRGYHWDSNDRKLKKFSGNELLEPQAYLQARTRVLEAFAQKAIPLLSEWQTQTPPRGRALFFTSLATYLR